ncbi:hypothetical protein [Agromyces binzhouensis]|uniref:hypothetical protein n=1 Tax=Agromyces binzhouensis TaxID=1817495 RepID=UPI00362A11AC
MAEYKVIWVRDHVYELPAQDVPEATKAMNTMAEDRWEPIHVSPGTSGTTTGGLFITFRRD